MHVELSSRHATPPNFDLALSFISSAISWLPAVTTLWTVKAPEPYQRFLKLFKAARPCQNAGLCPEISIRYTWLGVMSV